MAVAEAEGVDVEVIQYMKAPPDRETLDAALLLRLIERLHADIWRAHGAQLDPALDLVDAWIDAHLVLNTNRRKPRPPSHPLLDIF